MLYVSADLVICSRKFSGHWSLRIFECNNQPTRRMGISWSLKKEQFYKYICLLGVVCLFGLYTIKEVNDLPLTKSRQLTLTISDRWFRNCLEEAFFFCIANPHSLITIPGSENMIGYSEGHLNFTQFKIHLLMWNRSKLNREKLHWLCILI